MWGNIQKRYCHFPINLNGAMGFPDLKHIVFVKRLLNTIRLRFLDTTNGTDKGLQKDKQQQDVSHYFRFILVGLEF